MKILHLNLKGIYWDQIQSGDKDDEFRLQTEYWKKRLVGKTYDVICVKRGYPKKDDESKMLWKKWNGYKCIENFEHPHFGPGKHDVFAIDVREDLQ